MIICICRVLTEKDLSDMDMDEFYSDVECGMCEEEWIRLRKEKENGTDISTV